MSAGRGSVATILSKARHPSSHDLRVELSPLTLSTTRTLASRASSSPASRTASFLSAPAPRHGLLCSPPAIPSASCLVATPLINRSRTLRDPGSRGDGGSNARGHRRYRDQLRELFSGLVAPAALPSRSGARAPRLQFSVVLAWERCRGSVWTCWKRRL